MWDAGTCDSLESQSVSVSGSKSARTDPAMNSLAQRPRRRQRLVGSTNRRSTRKQKRVDPNGPTDEEFATLKTFESARGE